MNIHRSRWQIGIRDYQWVTKIHNRFYKSHDNGQAL